MNIRTFFRMYADGFREMTIGRTLWAIVILKLIVLFLIIRLFFFPNILQRDYDSDAERADAVRTNLCKPE